MSDQIDINQMDGACSTYGEEERCIYRVLVGKPEGKMTTWKTQALMEG